MAKNFRIELRIDAANRDEAVLFLEQKIASMRAKDWPDENIGGGGGGDECPNYSIYVGGRPMSLEERVRHLEDRSK